MKRVLLLFSFIFFLPSISFATYSLPSVYYVPNTSDTIWKGKVGVPNGIPNATTINTTLNAGSTTTQINNAITAANTAYNATGTLQVVKLGAGTFNMTGSILMKSGVVLRGEGKNVTNLVLSSGASYSAINWGAEPSYTSAGINLASGYTTRGSTSFTTSTDHLLQTGDIAVLDQVDSATSDPPMTNNGDNGDAYWHSRDPSGHNPSNTAVQNRSMGQFVRIASTPTATSFTIETPLYWPLTASLTPQVTGVVRTSIRSNSGVEDLTVDNKNSGSSDATVVMTGTYKCWIKNVELIGSYMTMLKTRIAYRCTIRNVEIHEGAPVSALGTPNGTGAAYGTSRAYGFWIEWASQMLLENNEIYHLDMPYLFCGQSSGNVVSYSYIHDSFYSPSLDWQPDTINFHGGHPFFNLFEGNLMTGGRMLADATWGSSSHNVFLRNKNLLSSSRNDAAWNMSLYRISEYFVFLDNILGGNGKETTYETTSTSSSNAARSIFAVDSRIPTAAKPLRHANWDAVTNGVLYSNADHVIPTSFYLDSRPVFYDPSYPWPSIGSELTPMAPSFPTLGSGTPWNYTGTPPTIVNASRSVSGNNSTGNRNLINRGIDLPLLRRHNSIVTF